MDKIKINNDKIKQILEKKLLKVPSEIKETFPSILHEKSLSWLSLVMDAYFMLNFIDTKENERLGQLKSSGYHPFPGLISENESMPVAFKLIDSRNMLISGCTIDNMFSFSLGENCTIILVDHNQSINTIELGKYNYIIKLAYIITFGSLINHDNLYDYLEDLIVYSINKWSSLRKG